MKFNKIYNLNYYKIDNLLKIKFKILDIKVILLKNKKRKKNRFF